MRRRELWRIPHKFVYDDVVGSHAAREDAARDASIDPRTDRRPAGCCGGLQDHSSTQGGLVTFPRRFHQLGLQSLALALAVAAFVVAPTAATASTGPAMPPASSVQSAGSCAEQWTAAYGTDAPASCEEQVLASRGAGAPSEPAAAVSDSPRAEAPDSGFDWGSAAIGAAALAALLAAGTLVAMALDRRSRVRTAS
jgi:hypothetical protein